MVLLRVAGLALALSLLVPPCGWAQPDEDTGREMFLRYCGGCHGPDGKGDGLLSGFLKKPPADLTQIAKKNGGEFPFHRTMRFIDGTQDVRAHGDPDMPVWGEVLKEEAAGSPTRQAEIRGKILGITTYVQTIQEE